MTTKQPHQEERYRKLLLEMSDQIRRDASSIEEQTRLPTGGQSDGGLSNTPMHLADMGTDLNLQEVNSVLLENEQYLFTEIQDALDRLDKGEFGRCQACGAAIDQQRLEAIPYTKRCVQCAAEHEQSSSSANVNSGRPRQSSMIERDDRQLKAQRQSASDGQMDRKSAMPNRFETNPGRDAAFESDRHAAGTAGGGTAVGGLAGTNIGRGDPDGDALERAMGSSEFDAEDGVAAEPSIPLAGHAGGAISGTPAGKRSRGAAKPQDEKSASRDGAPRKGKAKKS